MAEQEVPSDAPPSYQQATGKSSSTYRPAAASSSNSASATTDTPTGRAHLEVPGSSHDTNGGIPASYRRSMEDENRPLPKGWIRQFDSDHSHQFFVDTTKEPPRSIWVHPYDDEEYLSSLPGEERERIEQESMNRGHPPTKDDVVASHTDDEDDHHHPSSSTAELPPRTEGKGKGKERSFGRKVKDKLTGMTHEEREQERQRRAERERQLYEQHLRVRRAMGEAARTGQPQLIGKDRDGKDIYVQPPAYQGGYYGGGYGYDPYGRGGVYDTPNARYIRPANPYARPAGYGFGGGYGLPLALGGGLMGGLLLGDALGGGFGGGGF